MCARTPQEQAVFQRVLAEFFTLTKVGWKHNRCDDEIRRYKGKILHLSVNGRKGGIKRQAIAKQLSSKSGVEPEARSQMLDPDPEEPKTKATAAAPPPVDLPIWLPEPTWKAFAEMRKKMRAPLTPHACLLIFKKLAVWLEAGQNPQEVLEQSIENGWRGVFELRKGNGIGRSQDIRRSAAALPPEPGRKYKEPVRLSTLGTDKPN